VSSTIGVIIGIPPNVKLVLMFLFLPVLFGLAPTPPTPKDFLAPAVQNLYTLGVLG